MDEPARKRRRTNSPEERERQSSPLRKPARRPSFASPTKASLARSYPNLLRPKSAGGDGSATAYSGNPSTRGKQARAYVLGETGLPDELRQETSRETQTPAIANAQNTTPRARRVDNKRRAGNATGGADEEDVDLPLTPSQGRLGERRGILFSSPSRRPPLAKDSVKQSPLRLKAPRPDNGPSGEAVEDSPIEDEDGTGKNQGPDPEVEKRKQEKAQLQREIAELENQVKRCNEEIIKEQERLPEKRMSPTESNELSDFIVKLSGADLEAEKPVPISRMLNSFLPFSAFPVPQPRSKEPDKPIPSHRPVELADPLPYLELFTSLNFSTRISLTRNKINLSSSRVHQRHEIDITGPQKLLTAQLAIVIDTLNSSILEFNVNRLSPWADRELGAFIRSRLQEKDLGNACWAIDSYWDVAQKRAQYWHRIEMAFAHLITGRTNEDTENARPLAAKGAVPVGNISRKDLNRHLGRDTLVLQDSHVLLKLNWRISFDWTGEAESEISVEPAFPRVWSEADSSASLKKIPETYASLLRTKGAFRATKVMVGLLFAQ